MCGMVPVREDPVLCASPCVCACAASGRIDMA